MFKDIVAGSVGSPGSKERSSGFAVLRLAVKLTDAATQAILFVETQDHNYARDSEQKSSQLYSRYSSSTTSSANDEHLERIRARRPNLGVRHY